MIRNKDYIEELQEKRQGMTPAGPGNKVHQSPVFVSLISEHTFKWRSLAVSEACNWLTASAGPPEKYWNHRLCAGRSVEHESWMDQMQFLPLTTMRGERLKSIREERRKLTRIKPHSTKLVSPFRDYLLGHWRVWGYSNRVLTLNSSSLTFDAAFLPLSGEIFQQK